MTDDALGQLLERRVARDPSSVVTQDVVDMWISAFGTDWPECVGDVVPSIMYTTFARPSVAPAPDEVTPTGVVLHDDLKTLLELPVAIAVGYELKLSGVVRIGDQLLSEERIAELGPERSTKFGPGRDWVIEVASSTTAGDLVGVERFQMLGYRPGDSGAARPRTPQEPAIFAWTEDFTVTTDSIRREAEANHVWAGAHHHTEAAQKAGLSDIILDTSSQVARLAGAAQRHRPNDRIVAIDLAMKRSILPGATVTLGGIEAEHTTTVSAVVD
ncbi:MAG: hypothetical protein F2567_10160, partial [Actinobacteria bacterium]|nr:hypothetical protein [Actinomycetota bacterium]